MPVPRACPDSAAYRDMEYRQTAAFHSQEGRVGGCLLHRKGRRGKEHAITFPLVEVKQGFEEFRNGE
ncbi:MAG: hypothetical protein WD398_02935, partial [Cyclobacteriaceae bacterium]